MSTNYDKEKFDLFSFGNLNECGNALASNADGSVLYVCDAGNNRFKRLSVPSMTTIDAYDMRYAGTGNAFWVPQAIAIFEGKCFVVTSFGGSVEVLVYVIGSPEASALVKTDTIQIRSGTEFERIAASLMAALGFLFMPITVLSGSNYDNNLYKLSGDGTIIKTTLRAGHINGFSIG